MRIKKALSILSVAFALISHVGGCRDGEEPTPAQGLTVTLTNLFPDAGPTSYLVVRQCTGALCQSLASASVETAELATISVAPPEAETFDVVVYIPDDGAAWTVEEPFGEGYYASASALSDPEAQLWVSFWERLGDPAEARGGVLGAGEEPVFGSLEGQVVDGEGQGVAGLTVWIEGQGFAGTDEGGGFTLERVILGANTLHVAGPGVEETTLEVDVGTAPTPVTVPVALSSRGAPQQLEGVVVDAETDAPLADAAVSFADGTVVRSDDQGRFVATVADGTRHLTVTLEHYAVLRAMVNPMCYTDAEGYRYELDPLPQQLYGRWAYCYSEDSSGERWEPTLPNGAPDPITGWIFDIRSDGTIATSLPSPSADWEWSAWHGAVDGRWHLYSGHPSPHCGTFYDYWESRPPDIGGVTYRNV